MGLFKKQLFHHLKKISMPLNCIQHFLECKTPPFQQNYLFKDDYSVFRNIIGNIMLFLDKYMKRVTVGKACAVPGCV